MKVKTSDLKGRALHYAVAVCENSDPDYLLHYINGHLMGFWNYSSNWSQAGPIIEREGIEMYPYNSMEWHSQVLGPYAKAAGDTPLQAAMRCYVASKLGDEVEVPEELL